MGYFIKNYSYILNINTYIIWYYPRIYYAENLLPKLLNLMRIFSLKSIEIIII